MRKAENPPTRSRWSGNCGDGRPVSEASSCVLVHSAEHDRERAGQLRIEKKKKHKKRGPEVLTNRRPREPRLGLLCSFIRGNIGLVAVRDQHGDGPTSFE